MMKRLIFLLALAGCATFQGLTHDQLIAEQTRIDAYLSAKANGGAFAQPFYLVSDSVYHVPGKHEALIYANIQSLRAGDSCGTLPPIEFFYAQQLIDIQFKAARGE